MLAAEESWPEQIRLTVLPGQRILLGDKTKDEHAVIAGLGYGKSVMGVRWHYMRCVDNRESDESLVVAPNFKLLKSVCLAGYERFLHEAGMTEGRRGDYRVFRSPSDLRLVFHWGHTVHFLSAHDPENIVGYNASHIWIDEPAIMSEEVVNRVVGRLRCPKAQYRQILFTGTPEGTNWFYSRFRPEKVPRVEGTRFSESPTRLILHGRSHDNPYLPEQTLRIYEDQFAWNPALYQNYVLGEWTSLAQDRFYYAFEEARHVGDFPADPYNRQLYVTFDNNVGQLTWVAAQPVSNEVWVVRDNGGRARNLGEACRQFRDAFPANVWGRHSLAVFGDATLWARSNQTYTTGVDIIRDALRDDFPTLSMKIPRGNSLVDERNFSTNRLFGLDRLKIDRNCRKVVESARTAEFGPNRKVKKPEGDTWTHAMEAVDHMVVVLEPIQVKRGFQGLKAA